MTFVPTIVPDDTASPLPCIQVHGGDVAKIVDQVQDILLRAGKPVFVRAGNLITPIWDEMEAAAFKAVKAKTRVTKLVPLDLGRTRYMLNKRVVEFLQKRVYKNSQPKLVPVDPPDKVINTLLVLRHWKFPKISGVSNAPVMRPDGSIVTTKGFDVQTGMWLDWEDNLEFPAIKDNPSLEDAKTARNLLLGLVSGFPFKTELDKSVAMAAILTAVLRGGFDLAPMFLVAAHQAGSGKSFFVDVISTIINGRPCPVITVGFNKEETEKRLGAILLESPSIFSLDNLSGDLDGDVLCQMVTQQTVKIRVLGKSETPECEWRGTMFATGNNIFLVGDLTRRGLTIRLDPKEERPELRSFAFDPIESVLQHRGHYIAAAMTIVKAYMAASPQYERKPFAGFEGWSRFVREPLLWLSFEDPITSIENSNTNDPVRTAAHELIGVLVAACGTGKSFTTSDVVAKAREGNYEQEDFNTPGPAVTFKYTHPELHAFLMSEVPNKRGNDIEPRRLGRWMMRIDGQIYGKYCLRRKTVKSDGNAYQQNKFEIEQVQLRGE